MAVHVESDAERETRAAHLLQQIIKEHVPMLCRRPTR
jgi:hypothetical protein